jgi:hypothetical protein
MTMTREIWTTLVKAIGEIPNCPLWLRQQAQLSWDAVSQLPTLDATTIGQHAAPTVEQKVVAPDYLGFLREQIKLAARGQEWSATLRNRLIALEPFVGKQLLTAMFSYKPHSATLRVSPETEQLVHVEVN